MKGLSFQAFCQRFCPATGSAPLDEPNSDFVLQTPRTHTAARLTLSAVSLLLSAGASLATPQTATGIASSDAAPSRGTLLLRMRSGPMCFPHDMSEADMLAAMRRWPSLPTGAAQPRDRFNVDPTFVWVGAGQQGLSGRAQRASLTYSFPADSTPWGLQELNTPAPNVLNASLTALFGPGNIDLGREYIRQGLAAWRRYGGLDYSEVADSGIPMDQVLTRRSSVGDIRIGGTPFGVNTFLAYNAFPSAQAAGVGGGDMVINTSFFIPTNLNNPDNAYRYLRNVIAHEHGHGLGMIHQVPCNGTKLMEPNVNVGFETLSVDERRGAGRSYGDRFSGNQSPAQAQNLGNLTTPRLRSAIERDLSTNGASGPLGTSQDWFRFTIDSPQSIVITAAPTGDTYITGQQVDACNGAPVTVNAFRAGNLSIELYSQSGATATPPAPLLTAASALPGLNETLIATNLAPGEYLVRVFDSGPNAPADQIVQLYDLTVRVASSLAPPYVNAGLNKRVLVGQTCFFIGDINSAPTETGASLSLFEWDLDADGSFETQGPRPSRIYTAPGVVPVRLRVTDSNGLSSIDQISVTVASGPIAPVVSSISPSTLQQGSSTPVIITGSGFLGLSFASQVSVQGGDVAVEGTPIVNPTGTTITGLTFTAASASPVGPRSITVSNGALSSTSAPIFTITPLPLGACCDFPSCFIALASNCSLPGQRFAGVGTACEPPPPGQPPACCPADVTADARVNVGDIFAFLSFYFAEDFRADLDASFTFTPQDIFTFLERFFQPCP